MNEVEIELVVDCRIPGIDGAAEEQRVPIGTRLGDQLSRDIAGGPGAIYRLHSLAALAVKAGRTDRFAMVKRC